MSAILRRGAAAEQQEHSAALASRLGEDIVNGVLKASEKLNEAALAERYNVSRGPVREALRRLAERRLVVFTPNAGARVAAYKLEDMLNLLVVREALESLAARLAAQNMTPEEKLALRSLFEGHRVAVAAAPDGSYLQAPEDWDFHYLIAVGAHNPMLSNLLCDELYLVLRLCRTQHKRVTNRGRRALEEHYRILIAIEESDGDLAALQMQRHITASRKSLIDEAN